MNPNQEIITRYVSQLESGLITFDKLRSLLSAEGLQEPDLTQTIRIIDDEVQHNMQSASKLNRLSEVNKYAWVVTGIGVFLTAGSLLGYFGGVLFLAYGSLTVGPATLVAVRWRQQRAGEEPRITRRWGPRK